MADSVLDMDNSGLAHKSLLLGLPTDIFWTILDHLATTCPNRVLASLCLVHSTFNRYIRRRLYQDIDLTDDIACGVLPTGLFIEFDRKLLRTLRAKTDHASLVRKLRVSGSCGGGLGWQPIYREPAGLAAEADDEVGIAIRYAGEDELQRGNRLGALEFLSYLKELKEAQLTELCYRIRGVSYLHPTNHHISAFLMRQANLRKLTLNFDGFADLSFDNFSRSEKTGQGAHVFLATWDKFLSSGHHKFETLEELQLLSPIWHADFALCRAIISTAPNLRTLMASLNATRKVCNFLERNEEFGLKIEPAFRGDLALEPSDAKRLGFSEWTHTATYSILSVWLSAAGSLTSLSIAFVDFGVPAVTEAAVAAMDMPNLRELQLRSCQEEYQLLERIKGPIALKEFHWDTRSLKDEHDTYWSKAATGFRHFLEQVEPGLVSFTMIAHHRAKPGPEVSPDDHLVAVALRDIPRHAETLECLILSMGGYGVDRSRMDFDIETCVGKEEMIRIFSKMSSLRELGMSVDYSALYRNLHGWEPDHLHDWLHCVPNLETLWVSSERWIEVMDDGDATYGRYGGRTHFHGGVGKRTVDADCERLAGFAIPPVINKTNTTVTVKETPQGRVRTRVTTSEEIISEEPPKLKRVIIGSLPGVSRPLHVRPKHFSGNFYPCLYHINYVRPHSNVYEQASGDSDASFTVKEDWVGLQVWSRRLLPNIYYDVRSIGASDREMVFRGRGVNVPGNEREEVFLPRSWGEVDCKILKIMEAF